MKLFRDWQNVRIYPLVHSKNTICLSRKLLRTDSIVMRRGNVIFSEEDAILIRDIMKARQEDGITLEDACKLVVAQKVPRSLL